MIPYLVAGILGYLIGAIPSGYIVVKQLTGEDIRKHGSGGTGATNVRRVAGKKAALFVLFFDFHKGLVPVVIAKLLYPELFWLHVLVALSSVIGHSKSVFLGFSGGKSAATGLGGLAGLAWFPALLAGLVAFLVTKLSRYQSLGSLAACVTAPLLLWILKEQDAYLIYTTFASLYVAYMHKENIARLLTGTENRL